MHAFNSSILKANKGRCLSVQGQPGLRSEKSQFVYQWLDFWVISIFRAVKNIFLCKCFACLLVWLVSLFGFVFCFAGL